MTKVYLRADGETFSVRAHGHATGSNEVCAAVSCLLYTLAGYLANNTCAQVRVSLKEADAEIVFCGNENIFEMLCIGFLQLEKSHPDFISVECTV